MISACPFDGRGGRALGTCDECGATKVVRADVKGSPEFAPKVNEGQAVRKLTGHGWTLIRGRLRCPDCSAARAAKKHPEVKMSEAKEVPRQPSREQSRAIIDLLGSAYDTAAGQYLGKESDQTVAEALGAGIMPGWVQQLREQFFGLDGGNEETHAAGADLAEQEARLVALESDVAKMRDGILGLAADIAAQLSQVRTMRKQIDAIKRTMGPKAALVRD